MRIYVRVSIRIHVSDLAPLFFQFLPSGVRFYVVSLCDFFQVDSSSLSLEGNLFSLILSLSLFFLLFLFLSEICTSHESKERVRIIIR